MKCKGCGAELPYDAFGRIKCDYCGAQNYVPIPGRKEEEKEKPKVEPKPEPVKIEEPVKEPPKKVEEPKAKSTPPPTPEGKKRGSIAKIVVLLLILGVVGIGGYWYLSTEEYVKEPVGDVGEAKDLVLLTKEGTTKEGKSTYEVEYKWKGTTYRASGIHKVEGEPPIAPPEPFSEAMAWIKENTPKDAVVLSWWDYGNYIRLFASRETVVSDPCETERCLDTLASKDDIFRFDPAENVEDVARFFTSKEEDAYQIARKYGVDYVMVSYEEFGKSGAINHIAQDDLVISQFSAPNTGNREQDYEQISEILSQDGLNSYYIVNYGDRYQVWVLLDQGKPEMKDKLLARLLPFNTGALFDNELEHFKIVYDDPEYRYIYIYKIV